MSTVAQLAVEPLVVKYLPDCPDCDGTTYTDDVSRLTVTAPDVPPPDSPVPAVTPVMSPGFAATHSRPVVVALLTLRIYPLVEAAVSTDGVDAELADIKEPLAVRIDLSIKLDVSGATKSHAAPS
jgi:hypothetical protein